jgi:hypothetical protein
MRNGKEFFSKLIQKAGFKKEARFFINKFLKMQNVFQEACGLAMYISQ